MRFAVLVVVGLAACGPMPADIRSARAAVYAAPPDKVLAAARDVTEQLYGVASRDDQAHAFVTRTSLIMASDGRSGYRVDEARWGYVVRVQQVATTGHVMVVITPMVQREVSSCVNCPEHWVDVPLTDPRVRERVDAGLNKLTWAIYERAKQWEVRH